MYCNALYFTTLHFKHKCIVYLGLVDGDLSESVGSCIIVEAKVTARVEGYKERDIVLSTVFSWRLNTLRCQSPWHLEVKATVSYEEVAPHVSASHQPDKAPPQSLPLCMSNLGSKW